MLTEHNDVAPHLKDWRGSIFGTALAVVKPRSTDEVAAAVRICSRHNIGIVPQGGNTGLVGASIPEGTRPQIVMSLVRMNRIREIDPVDNVITVEAGCIIENVQKCARHSGRLFPLSFSADGSAVVGGVISTNAGGSAVLKYGMVRDLVIGLEVVLADGEIWSGLSGLRKDNTGYDLKQMFIGAEGTLGVITVAQLKLFPRPLDFVTLLVSLSCSDKAIEILRAFNGSFGDQVTSCELMSEECLSMVSKHFPNTRLPFDQMPAWSCLLEISMFQTIADLDDRLEGVLSPFIELGVIDDIAVAVTESQRAEMWRIRELISEAERSEGRSVKHDVAVRPSQIGAFIDETQAKVICLYPKARVVAFGHIGDGNVHFNVLIPEGAESDSDRVSRAITKLVYQQVTAYRGSISAEHGIGIYRRDALVAQEGPLSLDLMRRIRSALDPLGLMNPGKIFGPLATSDTARGQTRGASN